jgi:uncharacterized protein
MASRLAPLFDRSVGRGVVSAYLFGSRVRGGAHRESDVDVGVLLDRGRFPQRLDRSRARIDLLSEAIAALNRNEVDLVILNDLPPRFARTVLQGELLFCRDSEAEFAFRLRTQLLAADLDVFMRRMDRIKLEALRS